MREGKKKPGFSWKGIILAALAVLLVNMLVIGVMVFRTFQLNLPTEEDGSAAVQTEQTGQMPSDQEEMTGQTEMPDSSETEASEETEMLSEPNTELVSEAETESETESETAEPETEAEKLTVAIDPGHQGSWVDMSALEPSAPGSSEMKAKATTGTEGRFSGKKEYELNLEVSLLLQEELEARGYEVIMTREDHDTAISNSERALMAYEEGGDIYVRIHANGADDSSVRGALAMVPSASNAYVGDLAEDSYSLAECILDGYCTKASFDSLGIQYYDNMTGINWSRLPVMILEMGFMTNESDDLRMADPAVQAQMAEGIADGIDAYFVKKGMRHQEATPEAQAQADTIMEILGEEYIYPSQDSGETWAVSLIDLNTGAQAAINGDVSMKSASVVKAFILAAVYDRVCYPTSAERQIFITENFDGELKQLLTDMITVSSNEAANTLIERLGGGDTAVGMAVVNQFCEEHGYTETHLGRLFLEADPTDDNYVSANDCSRLMASIYNGTCVNQEASAKMYEYFKNQTRISKIPAGLNGTGAVSANKTGELCGEYGDYVENDIAVIEAADSNYVLSVLSASLRDNGAGAEQIAAISRTVYEQIQKSDIEIQTIE